jgi:hypothetical protein
MKNKGKQNLIECPTQMQAWVLKKSLPGLRKPTKLEGVSTYPDFPEREWNEIQSKLLVAGIT